MLLWWKVIWSYLNVQTTYFQFKSLKTKHTFPQKYIYVHNERFTYFWKACAFGKVKIKMRRDFRPSSWNIIEKISITAPKVNINHVELIDTGKQTLHQEKYTRFALHTD